MELRFEIAEEHLRVFVAALHCLAQVGKELSLECEGAAALTCRALNDAHSASGQISFGRAFFAAAAVHHRHESDRARIGRAVPFAKCKVYAKPCCNVFRTLKHVRSVELVFRVDDEQLALDSPSQDELDVDCVEVEWRLRCDFDVTKTHRMKVHACQVMRAVFDRASCANRLVTRQHHLASLLAHIRHSSEVCVTCTATHAKFESYAASGSDGKAQLHTETAVESIEFSEYALAPSSQTIDASVQLIFTLKEVRSTSKAKVAVEITLSTITTFLPASSQTRSEDELPNFHHATLATAARADTVASSISDEAKESDASQPNERYLTHSKHYEDYEEYYEKATEAEPREHAGAATAAGVPPPAATPSSAKPAAAMAAAAASAGKKAIDCSLPVNDAGKGFNSIRESMRKQHKSEKNGLSGGRLILQKLINRGELNAVHGAVRGGKEARVYFAVGTDERTMRERQLAVKKSQRQQLQAWIEREFRNLSRAVKHVRAPQPLAFKEHVIDAHLVHGDLSKYNILFFQHKCWLVDFGQAADRSHPNYHAFLKRDLANVHTFFERAGLPDASADSVGLLVPDAAFEFVTSKKPLHALAAFPALRKLLDEKRRSQPQP
ncbi:hypothetical protein PybrP1_004126 [[Pythium] brassicae (nom. inval.)]|nr:hypothetical protein PybrP1_004126 [[Pythium] brassicae (nom. inval.)]